MGVIEMKIRKAKVMQDKLVIWEWGNARSYKRPRLLPRIGFSGSMVEPYTSLHIYIWKIDVWFVRNPLKWLMDKWGEYKLNRALKADPEARCPKCNSHKLREGNGFAYEPLIYCKACSNILWAADPTPYIE